MFAGEAIRLAGFDGTTNELASTISDKLVPWISEDWKKQFTWPGRGVMPAEEKQRLAQLVARAHGQGRRVRFWGAPDNETFWTAMLEAEVDLINTDDLAGLAKFLRAQHD